MAHILADSEGKFIIGADTMAEWGFPIYNGFVVHDAVLADAEGGEFVRGFLSALAASTGDYISSSYDWAQADSPYNKIVGVLANADAEAVATYIGSGTFKTFDGMLAGRASMVNSGLFVNDFLANKLKSLPVLRAKNFWTSRR
jgi:ABC-type taurine transport system substrate-binding protein